MEIQNPIIDLLENCLERSGIKPVEKILSLKRKRKPSPTRIIKNTQIIKKGLNNGRTLKKSLKCDSHKFLVNTDNTKNNMDLTHEEIKKTSKQSHSDNLFNDTFDNKQSNKPASLTIICSTEEDLKKTTYKKALDPQYRCNLCGRKYSSQSALKIHKIRHKKKEELPFPCLFCPYKSATKKDLHRHHNQHIGHARQIYKCELCSKVFKINSSLIEHIKSVHTKESTYKCGICDFSTSRRSSMRIHLKAHNHSKVQIICPICQSSFQNKSNLKIHLMTHADAKPFGCSKCDKRFTVNSRLVAHHHTVHEPKNFECDICHKRFPSIHRLKRHSLTHSGEKPFKCCFCPFTSSTQGNLIKHVRNVHKKIHFTYKDLLRKIGEMDDPKKELSPIQIERLVESGREVSESLLKKFREKGLSTASLEQLQRNLRIKKEAEVIKMHQMEEKRQKESKSSKTRSEVEEKKKKKKKTNTEKGNKKRENKRLKCGTASFDLSNCDDFILPQMDNGSYVIQSNNNIDGVEVLPTTRPIQVVWNVGNVDKESSHTKAKRKRPTRPRSKASKGNSKLKSMSGVSAQHVNLSLASDNLNSPSNMLEDSDLNFSDKASVLNSLPDAADFPPNNNVLVTSLANLHHVDHLVDFEGMESPNTVVVTADGIAEIDRVYKNLDLYNQFLNLNEEYPHIMNGFECSPANKESGKAAHKVKVIAYSEDNNEDRKGKKESVSVVPLPFAPPLRKCSSLESLARHTKSISRFTDRTQSAAPPQKDDTSSSLSSNESKFSKKLKRKTVNPTFKSAQKISRTIHSIGSSFASPQSSQLPVNAASPHSKMTKKETEHLQPEQIIVLHEHSEEISRNLPRDPTEKETLNHNHNIKEITIKNSQSMSEEVEVVAIAEIDEVEKDVVLTIDSSG